MVILNEEQRAAVEATQPLVCVSAGAGTGKTSLLVEWYVQALLREGLSTAELPTVTFTRKAAGEMRSRIRERLHECGRSDLAWRLDEAPIGTIHSLCARLLRTYAAQAGLDPGFSVLEEDQAAILRAELLQQIWERRVETACPEELRLLARFRRELRGELEDLYLRLRQRGHVHPQFPLSPPAGLEVAREELLNCVQKAEDALEGAALGKTAEANRDKMRALRSWLADGSPGSGADLVSLETCERLNSFLPNLNCGAVRPLFRAIRDAVLDFRARLAACALYPVAELMDALLRDFGSAYEERKRGLSVLDFTDLEIKAKNLVDSGMQLFSPRAQLIVDEFQDTNGLQFGILRGLGCARLLTVGDERQSIYGFRGAEVEVFRGWAEEMSELQSRQDSHAVVVRLGKNYRSPDQVLEVINRIFAGEALFGLDYLGLKPYRTNDVPRRPHSMEEHGRLSPGVEILVLRREDARLAGEDWHEAECRAVADRVQRLLVEEGWKPQDVVVLLRSLSWVAEYEEALRANGVPTYVVEGRGYFEREELCDILALLQLLVNPHDDAALVTVLRSPLVGLSDDALVLAREACNAARQPFLWAAVQEADLDGLAAADKVKLERFRQGMRSLRPHLGVPGLPVLIERAITTFDYDLAVLRLVDGRQRMANLRKLMGLAEEFESRSGPDVAGFLRHLALRREARGDREGNAPLRAEQDDRDPVVRVMTIHQAKGLEFPVVLLAGMGSRAASRSPSFEFSPDMAQTALSVRQTGGNSLQLGPADVLRADRLEREREEEIRLYYVAMTRSEERLILMGSMDNCDRSVPLGWVLAALGIEDLLNRGSEASLPGLDASARIVSVPPRPARRGQPRGFRWQRAADPPLFPATQPQGSSTRWVSFSSLALYRHCPRRFYLERVLGLSGLLPSQSVTLCELQPTQPSGFFRGTEWDGGVDLVDHVELGGRKLGLVVHKVLEQTDLIQRASEPDLQKAAARAAVELGLSLGEEILDEAAKLTARFWESPVATHFALSSAVREEPFVFRRGDMLVSGVIDLMIPSAHEWLIVDYKTNRLESTSPEQEVDARYSLQASIYSLAGLMAGAPCTKVVFLFLEAPQKPVVVKHRISDLPELEAVLDQALGDILVGDFHPSGDGCLLCEGSGICKALSGRD